MGEFVPKKVIYIFISLLVATIIIYIINGKFRMIDLISIVLLAALIYFIIDQNDENYEHFGESIRLKDLYLTLEQINNTNNKLKENYNTVVKNISRNTSLQKSLINTLSTNSKKTKEISIIAQKNYEKARKSYLKNQELYDKTEREYNDAKRKYDLSILTKVELADFFKNNNTIDLEDLKKQYEILKNEMRNTKVQDELKRLAKLNSLEVLIKAENIDMEDVEMKKIDRQINDALKNYNNKKIQLNYVKSAFQQSDYFDRNASKFLSYVNSILTKTKPLCLSIINDVENVKNKEEQEESIYDPNMSERDRLIQEAADRTYKLFMKQQKEDDDYDQMMYNEYLRKEKEISALGVYPDEVQEDDRC